MGQKVLGKGHTAARWLGTASVGAGPPGPGSSRRHQRLMGKAWGRLSFHLRPNCL